MTDFQVAGANSFHRCNRSERSIQKLIVLRNSVIRSYQMHNIPTAWMLDSGISSKVSFSMLLLVK